MSNWIIRCANTHCNHICNEGEWVLKPKDKPTEADIKLQTKVAHCPKCGCKTFYKAKPAEIDRLQRASAKGGAE